MRRSNIRILNVAEETGSSSPSSVSKLLKEALKMDKDVLVDRSLRTTQPKRPDGKPRAIIIKTVSRSPAGPGKPVPCSITEPPSSCSPTTQCRLGEISV